MLPSLYECSSFRESDSLIACESSLTSDQLTSPQKLQWNISQESANDINTAKRNLDKYGTNSMLAGIL